MIETVLYAVCELLIHAICGLPLLILIKNLRIAKEAQSLR
jgi:hypothetical protein